MSTNPNPFDPELHGGVQFDHSEPVTGFDDRAAKVRFRLKGSSQGPIYQGQHIYQGCVGCGQPVGPFRKRLPKPFRIHDPLGERAIVIPWLSTAVAWSELKFSLRAIHRHFTDRECPIYIIGDAAPLWLRQGGRVRFIPIDSYKLSKEAGLFEAVQLGMQIADTVGWWNDDIYLLRDTGWDDMRVALTDGDLRGIETVLRQSGVVWQIGLGEAVEDLKLLGKTTFRFATHTPYLFEIEKSREIFRTFYLHHKGSWVTLYHNFHATPHMPEGPWKVQSLPSDKPAARYLNHRHTGPDKKTKEELVRMFPDPAPWEL
ncbi:MAG: hypothetical protein ABIT37_01600 [Luteolibacter sp.]